MAKKKRKPTAEDRPRRSYYQLALFAPAIAPVGFESCGCAELKPGLDASICSHCNIAWRHPYRQEIEPLTSHAHITEEVLKLTPISSAPAALPASAVIVKPRLKSAIESAPPPPKSERETVSNEQAKTADDDTAIAPRFCLTVTPEEAFALTEFGADLINKNYPSPLKIGERFLLAAGRDPRPISTHSPLNETLTKTLADLGKKQPLGIVAIATFEGAVERSDSQWWGRCKFGWRVKDIEAIAEPIPCEYHAGLWQPSPSQLARLPTG